MTAGAAGRKDWSSTDNKALNHSLDSSRHGQYQPPPYLTCCVRHQTNDNQRSHPPTNQFIQKAKRVRSPKSKSDQSFRGNRNSSCLRPFRTEKPKPDTMPIWQDFDFLIVLPVFAKLSTTQIPLPSLLLPLLESWLAKFLVCAHLAAVEPLKWWGTFLSTVALMVWGRLVWTISLNSRNKVKYLG